MRRIAIALGITVLGVVGFGGTASAGQLYPYAYEKSFNGSDSTGGAFTNGLTKVAINQTNGRVYVLDTHLIGCCTGVNYLSQFTPDGDAVPFSALAGVSSINLGTGGEDVIFDNTGHGSGIWAYGSRPDGNLVNLNEDGSERIEGGAGGSYGNCGLGIDPEGFLYQGSTQGMYKIDPTTGFPTPDQTYFSEQEPCSATFDSQGYAYLQKSWNYDQGGPGLYKYYKGNENITCCTGVQGFSDRESLQISNVPTYYSTADLTDDDIFAVENENQITQYTSEGAPVITFGGPAGSYGGLQGARGVAINQTTKDIYVPSLNGSPRIDIFQRLAPVTVPDVTTAPPGHPDANSAVLRGIVNPAGVTTTECKIEWGAVTPSSKGYYDNGTLPCDQGDILSGSSDQEVSHEVKSLTTGQVYHYRVAARNANGYWKYSADRRFEASVAPTVTPLLVDRVNTDGARFTAQIDPRGGTTSWHYEYGTEDCETHECAQVPLADSVLASRLGAQQAQATAIGLKPATQYYVMLVAENGAGRETYKYTFRTYPSPPDKDVCSNALVRQQVSAFLLPDCRAYELVSAANAAGYEVESDLVPGQTPYPGFPDAKDRVLYGLHFGSIPGVGGEPTNYGVDPYVAERTVSGWISRYVGLPAGGMADKDPFGSPVLDADRGLSFFAFGGPGICDPCFAGDGTNIPLRLAGGPPVEGMVGSQDPGEVAPEGSVAKYLSDDGSHLVFGSTKQFEPAGASGALTIYERDLAAGTTRVVSTDQNGATLSGPGVSELDLSSDGSRVIVGNEVSTDAAGNVHNHLYMHVGAKAASADLTPGGSAVYSGMTADGSRVFMTTVSQLSSDDTDASADIYEVDVDGSGNASPPQLVTTRSDGSPSNSDACSPAGNPASWNSVAGDGMCGAVAFAGGAGVASRAGTFFFLSPEQLDGTQGNADQANLYVVAPGGAPHFVATIDSSGGKELPIPQHPVESSSFTGGSLSTPEAMAVDDVSGDLYVNETGAGRFARFNPDGTPHDFTAGPGAGTNKIAATVPGSSLSQIAVDNSSGPFARNVYVTDTSSKISVYGPTGSLEGTLLGTQTSLGSWGTLCGVAVDPSSGVLYAGDSTGHIWRYAPKPGASAPIDDSDYTATGITTSGMSPCQVAADGLGNVYAVNYANGPARKFEAASFGAGAPGQTGTQVTANARALAVDSGTNELHVSQSNQVAVFKPNAELVTIYGNGSMSGSRGIAVNGVTHHSYVPNNGPIVHFGYVKPPFEPITNPAIVHGVRQAATHSTADFQVTPNGRFAVFASTLGVTGFANLGKSEIYRYDGNSVECASCPPTGAAAQSDTTLTPHGINVTESGKVFFTSREGMVLSDTNERLDVYEWNGGANMGRISSGSTNADSSLLTATNDSVDVYFFTRQVLVPQDENGGAVKIYDAREFGGFPTDPPRPACAASDECHGPGTEAPPAPPIRTITGNGQNSSGERNGRKPCRKKGFVKRKGKCVRKHPKHKRKAGHHG